MASSVRSTSTGGLQLASKLATPAHSSSCQPGIARARPPSLRSCSATSPHDVAITKQLAPAAAAMSRVSEIWASRATPSSTTQRRQRGFPGPRRTGQQDEGRGVRHAPIIAGGPEVRRRSFCSDDPFRDPARPHPARRVGRAGGADPFRARHVQRPLRPRTRAGRRAPGSARQHWRARNGRHCLHEQPDPSHRDGRDPRPGARRNDPGRRVRLVRDPRRRCRGTHLGRVPGAVSRGR